LGADGAEANKELVVDGPCVVQDCANDSLDTFDAGIVEGRARVLVVRELALVAVNNQLAFEGREL